MKLALAYSPCPNDTFIFGALINQLIDTEGLEFEVVMDDVESLNRAALKHKYPITKLSFGMYANVIGNYHLLSAGAALGRACGPLLISRQPIAEIKSSDAYRVAIPGKNTTANFLLNIFFPALTYKKEMLFSEIQPALIRNEIDLGLIIHESRFTYEKSGLYKVADLGELWENATGFPIPLGGIFIDQQLPLAISKKVNRLIKKSIEFARNNPDAIMPYVREHANEMDEGVMKQHIDLYVNNYSLNLGEDGKEAVRYLLTRAGKDKSLLMSELNWLVQD
jgi:1,4-dihydroxy-6-naphthoate synthase